LDTAVNFAVIHETLAKKLFDKKKTRELTKLVALQSCAKEALLLADIEGVHAMHDATEGGLIAALNEITEASDVGFKLGWENLLIPEEVHLLREAYQLSDTQVLSMSSTGTFLAAVCPEARDKVEAVLRQNCVDVRFLGSFTKNRSRLLVKNGKETVFPRDADDPYARFLSAKR
jgi:hydrogenase expression/formation protein HypE